MSSSWTVDGRKISDRASIYILSPLMLKNIGKDIVVSANDRSEKGKI